MTADIPADAVWRKSSRSNGDGNVCVEIALLPGRTGVRDSKDPVGAALVLTATAWELFHRTLVDHASRAASDSPSVRKERVRDD